MKRSLVFIVIPVIILLYSLLNYYIGLRGYQTLLKFTPHFSNKLYWLFFWLLALAYLIGRLTQNFLPTSVGNAITLIGSYWLAAMLYFFLFLVAIDLVRFLDVRLGFLPAVLKQNSRYIGLAVLVVVMGTLVYGTWQARTPRIVHYELTIPKHAGSLQQLHVVVASDIHLGTIVGSKQLNQMVEMMNGLKPDIVLFPGDVIDESVGPFVEQKMAVTLKRLQTKYGSFAVTGNHEYIGGHVDEAIHYLNEAGVVVLRDEKVQVAQSFYLVGRDDRSGHSFAGKQRQDISVLMTGVDRSLPVILMDHQPSKLNEAAAEGVDLQLSGHTHQGQFFPINLITQRIFEIDHGYLRKGQTQYIVTSGFGTWGPPIRVGTSSEILDVVIHFTK